MADKGSSGSSAATDTNNPLYIHPSDGPTSISVEKLTGPADYRPWQRTMEINLAAKRKLGFVTSAIKRDSSYPVKQEQWDTCNHLVIAWVHRSVSDQIKKSILCLTTEREIWMQLETLFNVTNGARKYKLNKEAYETEQNGNSINEYYTVMKGLREEQDALNILPPITKMTIEIDAFIGALNRQKEELRLFQFLTRLNEDYKAHRSQILMQSPLSTVEAACAQLQQEESQRDMMQLSKLSLESSTMYGKGQNDIGCIACGGKGHKTEKCWTVVGYPRWHPKARAKRNQEKQKSGKNGERFKPKAMAVNTEGKGENQKALLTEEQVEQLLKLLPSTSKTEPDMEDESEPGFVGMISYCMAAVSASDWVIDTGASDHITYDIHVLKNAKKVNKKSKINLPNGEHAIVSHIGDMTLENDLNLNHVMGVPEFRHNLLSVSRLVKYENCKVIFYPDLCVIQDSATQTIKAIGKVQNGLYYLVNKPLRRILNEAGVGRMNEKTVGINL
ncbi:Retrovirus-related Pol polyprotein from transposon RE1 [Bienertia sinuspersici]